MENTSWGINQDDAIHIEAGVFMDRLKEIIFTILISSPLALGFNEAYLRTDAAEAANYIVKTNPVLAEMIVKEPHAHEKEIEEILSQKWHTDVEKNHKIEEEKDYGNKGTDTESISEETH